MSIKGNLLAISDMSDQQILTILDLAKAMKKRLLEKNMDDLPLRGRSVVTLFYEDSTRTRLSFELAAKQLGATCSSISVGTSSVNKGENLIDTGRTIDRMGVDLVVIRHPSSGAAQLMADNVNASVVNAGDGSHQHPTQALLDAFTIREHKGDIKGLKIAIIGDITHSRVARSNLECLTKLGAKVAFGGPATMLPAKVSRLGAEVFTSVSEAIADADVVMCLRIQQERQNSCFLPSTGEYARFFGIDEKRLVFAKPDCIVMHPAPVNRAVEIASEVVDGERSVICEQTTNGVALRMAVLAHLILDE